MIACYAWTDTQILNLVQIKEFYYGEESADLFICKLDRLSIELINEVENYRLFDNIYVVDPVQYSFKFSCLEKVPFILGVKSTINRKKYYNNIYSNIIGNKVYKTILTAGFWGDSLFLLKYLLYNNKNIKIQLIEEGALSYCAPIKRLCKAKPLGCQITWKDRVSARIIEILILGRSYLNLKNKITKFFVHEPLAVHEEFVHIKTRIPKVDFKQDICSNILKNIGEKIDIKLIDKNDIFFFPTPLIDGYEDNRITTYEILDTVVDVLQGKQLLVKLHPSMIKNELDFGKKYKRTAYFDKTSYPFEVLARNVDLSNKILISRNTSCLLMAKYMFGYEPIIVYTYKLYDRYKKDGEPDLERYVKGLKALYNSPEKIMVPENMRELYIMLTRLKDIL